jgi:hypothetical protein
VLVTNRGGTMQKVCLICNINFEAKRKNSTYCSTKCKKSAEYQRRPTIQKNCLNCNKQFETKRNNTEYCSSSCSNTACKTHDDVKLNCKECNKDFTVKYIHRDKLFCSRSCATIHQNKIMYSNNDVRNKISQTKKQQYASGEVIHPFIGKTHSKETKNKLSEIKITEGKWKGENNPAYGGQSKEVREKMSKTRAERIQSGEIKLSKGECVFFQKANKEVFARSSWEKDYIEKIDEDQNIISAIFEPFVLPYYYDQGRNYIPDILIIYKDGTKKLVEIKPSYFLDAEINKCKFAAAQKYCKEKGMIFEVWTEKSNPYILK